MSELEEVGELQARLTLAEALTRSECEEAEAEIRAEEAYWRELEADKAAEQRRAGL